jgi:hypothetical protein
MSHKSCDLVLQQSEVPCFRNYHISLDRPCEKSRKQTHLNRFSTVDKSWHVGLSIVIGGQDHVIMSKETLKGLNSSDHDPKRTPRGSLASNQRWNQMFDLCSNLCDFFIRFEQPFDAEYTSRWFHEAQKESGSIQKAFQN